MEGELFIYDKDKRHCAFESGPKHSAKCMIFIGGLTDGLLSLPYLTSLSKILETCEISLVQFIMSSSYSGFGLGSLERDASELQCLISHMVEKRGKNSIALFGHSTGCQDIMWYLTKACSSLPNPAVKLAILQAPTSDREYFFDKHPELARKMLDWAICHDPAAISPFLYFGVPISSYRIQSFLQALGDDDFFSTDLTSTDRADKFSGISVPTFILFSRNDETVPNLDRIDLLLAAFTAASPAIKQCIVLDNAVHAVEHPDAINALCNHVREILASTKF